MKFFLRLDVHELVSLGRTLKAAFASFRRPPTKGTPCFAREVKEIVMGFSIAQMQLMHQIGRAFGHLWATELDIAEVAREGVSAQEIRA